MRNLSWCYKTGWVFFCLFFHFIILLLIWEVLVSATLWGFLVLNTMHFNLFVFIVFLCSTYFYGNYFLVDCDIPSSSPPPSPYAEFFVRICTIFTPKMYPSNEQNRDSILFILDLSCYDAFQILFLTFGVIYLLWLFLLYLTTHVTYVNFNTNLNLYNKKTTICFGFFFCT